jgi:CBS domain-containing membrane protein
MKFSSLNECSVPISDDDIIHAMKQIPGYLDITPSDFMEVYRVAFGQAMSRLQNSITAEQIMTRNVIKLHEDAPLIEAIIKMAENEISGLLVVKNDQRVAGVISKKDFLKKMNPDKVPSFMRVLLHCFDSKGCLAKDFKNLKTADLMSSPCICVDPHTPVMEIAGIMDREKINRVPVIDEDSKLVGIIARSDIVQTMC